jgi:hypothetical protein
VDAARQLERPPRNQAIAAAILATASRMSSGEVPMFSRAKPRPWLPKSGPGLSATRPRDRNSHHAELAPAAAAAGIALLRGQEVTTQGGHAEALADIGWIDFREAPDQWLARAL